MQKFENVQVLAAEGLELPRIITNTMDRDAAVPTFYQSIVGDRQEEDNDSQKILSYRVVSR